MERAVKGFNENGVCRKTSQAAGFPQEEYPLNPSIPLFIVAPLHHVAPKDGESQGSLGPVIGWIEAFLDSDDTCIKLVMKGKPAFCVLWPQDKLLARKGRLGEGS